MGEMVRLKKELGDFKARLERRLIHWYLYSARELVHVHGGLVHFWAWKGQFEGWN